MMRAPAKSFYREFTKIDGNRIRGQFGTVLEENNVRNFVLPRRYLITDPEEALVPGDILDLGFRMYLMMDHAEKSKERSKIFKMAEITRKVRWRRQKVGVDLVTGMNRDVGLEDLGDLYVCWEFVDLAYDNETRKNSKIRILTGAAIQPQDKLDEGVVHFVESVRGIYYAELT